MVIYFWRFLENTENYPGWNLAATTAGTVALLRLVERLATGQTTAEVIDCADPTPEVLAIPNNGRAAVSAARRLCIACVDLHESARLAEQDGTVTLSVSSEQVKQLISALERPDSAFDTGILDHPAVWYWGVVPDASKADG